MAGIGVVSLVLLSPVLGHVYASLGTARRANVVLVALAVVCAAVGFVSTWALQRLALRVDRWSDVAGPQLAGNAASNLLPMGSIVGVVLQLRMLRRKGVDLTRSMTSLTIAGLLSNVAGLCVFPALLVLPIGDSDIDVAGLTRSGLVALVVCVPVAVAVLRSDRVLRWVGRACYRAVRSLPRCSPPPDLAERIVVERNAVRDAVARRKTVTIAAALGRSMSEYLALYASMLAVGLRPSPPIVLAAFLAGNAAGMIPFTPGGLGFVEAGLGGIFVLSGAPEEHALAGVAIYRLATTWLPVVAGVAAYVLSGAALRAPTEVSTAATIPDVAVEPVSLV